MSEAGAAAASHWRRYHQWLIALTNRRILVPRSYAVHGAASVETLFGVPDLREFLVTAALLAACAFAACPARAQTFEQLVEDALQHNDAGTPPSAVPPRLGVDPAAPPAEPAAPPPGPTDLSKLPGASAQPAAPKPYTPPTSSEPAAAEATAPVAGDAAANPPPAEPPSTSGGERTQASLGVDEVNAANFSPEALAKKGANPLVLKAQILLDRAGASPGVIDGIYGGNVAKAIAAVETVLSLSVDGKLDPQVWAALGGDEAPAVLISYTITEEDAAYPFLHEIPADYAVQATLKALGYTSPEEMFSERFHMDIKLLKALNPDIDMRQAGATIVVADVEGQPITGKIARIEADKNERQVRAYDAENRLVVAYPATIGSADNPSPSGTHRVNTIAPNPVYYYNPQNFLQGKNTGRLQLPPGPNNPVGTMWIDLSEPSYGIHGTPEPSKIDKTGSHGCIRLTNWDANELATLVQPGVEVTFTE